MATNHQETAKRLKKVRTVRYVLSTVGIIIVVLGIWQLVRLLWDYKQNETTNNAQVEQYISPINVRASGYIRSIRFTEHQFVHKGDTLLLLDDSEYRIRLKEAEANLKITQSSADVTQSALDKTRGNVLVYDANIRETEAKVEMAIICVPAESAQEVADELVAGGVRLIWNFSNTCLQLPPDVVVQREVIAGGYALLSRKRKEHFS